MNRRSGVSMSGSFGDLLKQAGLTASKESEAEPVRADATETVEESVAYAPKVVVLDEATSALDVATERHLYELLVEREMAVVSVGHRPTLKSFHDLVLELNGQGGWQLLPAASYDFGHS